MPADHVKKELVTPVQDPKKAEGLGWNDKVKPVTADVTSSAR